jgi:hypothetical protein
MIGRKTVWHEYGTALLLAACAAIAVSPMWLQAQDDDERRLWDSEFLKKRQVGTTTSAPHTPPAYKRTSPDSVPADKGSGEIIGVTIWRLRPSSASDAPVSRLLIQDDDKPGAAEWTPERVEAETRFSTGEPVRLSIESPRNGYLYVIDREQYDDGSASDPYLIFPTQRIRGADNAVSSGKVIELPNRSAFRLKPMRPDYKGELLTLIVTAQPLREITAGPAARRLDRSIVEQWERQWSTRTDRFEMVGGMGKTYTRSEKEAGIEGRLLTQEDELPQTLYHVTAKPGDPLLVSIPLLIAK